ncbi:hypothetical protein [Rhizobium leguminosarum]|uniref:hypothetical protein n=1 Tax=Rhizobium leguminosarum TaxID=384 RepID=UPI001039C056|nr:hypothetical protein [Rhizobium leguminosarum]TCA01026.1 hypothetical protein E0H68_37340 [Rhizobium leguminosarum bv. viciae]TCA13782.1 hypothetical protein E0H67_37525 [Rhizobium leguminosarum bv. viciae]
MLLQYLVLPGLTVVTLLASSTTGVSADEQPIVSRSELSEVKGVDLGIADDETFKRPNSWGKLEEKGSTKYAEAKEFLLPTEVVLGGEFSGPASRPGMSIAWRNAAQVEEVEVRVRNLGDTAAEARVWVDILDEEGKSILQLAPPDDMKTIRMPAFLDGGREGKILRMKSSRELNNIIDKFDRDDRRYDVRATVETIGAVDVNPLDNTKGKSWNVPHSVKPDFMNAFNYVFKNDTPQPKTVRWLFERTPYPAGWKIEGIPANNEPFVLAAGEAIRGALTMKAPSKLNEADFLEARLSLIEIDKNTIWQQREWFQVYDTIPPTVTDYRLVMTADHRVAIQVLVSDEGSGVLEATGVTTQFSTNGGLTWAGSAHNYKAGNFVVPTLFEAVIGPFASETDLQIRFTALDTARNSTSIIPEAAIGIVAPAGAEKLLDLAAVFPRTQPNAIYTLDPGKVDMSQVASEFALAVANSTSDPARVDAIGRVLKEVPIDAESKKTLMDAAKRFSTETSKATIAQRFQELVTDLPTRTVGDQSVEELQLKRIVAPETDKLQITTLGLQIK